MTQLIIPESLFEESGGHANGTFPAMHAPVYTTEQGTSYLKAPGVVLIGHTMTNLDGIDGFLDGFDESLQFSDYLEDLVPPLPDGSRLSKFAGQLCYMSLGPRRTKNAEAKKYFTNIKAQSHGSVIEHATFTFLFYGVSRSLTHELVRHRLFSFSQVSQRFVSGRTLRFVERPEYQSDSMLHKVFQRRIDRVATAYARLTDRLLEMQRTGSEILSAEAKTNLRKKVQQAARSVLPNETEAPIVVSGNARNWRHFIEMRASSHAEIEIRRLAVKVFLCLQQVDPILFDDYVLTELSAREHAVESEYRKV